MGDEEVMMKILYSRIVLFICTEKETFFLLLLLLVENLFFVLLSMKKNKILINFSFFF